MDLLDRYLQAVKFWLPRKQKQDILAELSEDIRSEIEDKEAELGRPARSSRARSHPHRWGHPMLVAERYLPQRSLIGPVLLPAYTLVLKIATLVYLVPWLLVLLGFVIFDPDAPDAGRHRRRAAVVLAHRSSRRGRASPRSSPSWNGTSSAPGPGRRGARASCSNMDRRATRTRSRARNRSRSWSLGLITVWWWVRLLGSPTSYHFADTFRITCGRSIPGCTGRSWCSCCAAWSWRA